MSEQIENNDVEQLSDESTQTSDQQSNDVNVADVEARIAELEAQIAKQHEIVEKARKGEKYQKSRSDSEVKKILAQYEEVRARADALEQRIRDSSADTAIKSLLQEGGAKAVDTALKLIDKKSLKFSDDGVVDQESVKAAVDALKQSDSFLFEPSAEITSDSSNRSAAPPAKRSTEAEKISGFESELRGAKTAADLQKVLRKYGKL